MGNILIFSDTHISDYTYRNPSDKYRLYQGSRIVPQNIIKVAKENNADTVFIAGDLIDRSVVRPYVLSEVKLFLDTIMGHFKEGRIIYGNHDLDSKLPNQKLEDCLLSVILPSNLKYADKTFEVFGNSTIGFSNWRPNEIDLSWLPAPVDYLITHATISYSPGDYFQSTKIDESKFGLCFSGDIHKPAVKDKFVSIGVPQRCKMGDSDQATGIILDPVGKRWKHVNLNPDDNLLKMEYVKDRALEGYHSPTNTWFIYKPDDTVYTKTSTISTKLWTEVDALITDCITQEGLVGVHQGVLKRVPADLEELDLGFTLTALRCHNWRSISDLSIIINPGDRIVLHGHNGAGKSSILSALKYALIESKKSLAGFVCNKGTDKSAWSEVDFMYQGHQYTLRRGTSNSTKNWGLVIDGQVQAYPNITSFNKDVSRRFPFLEVLKYFYFDDQHPRFLGDMKDEEKPILISKLLRLSKIDSFHDTASMILGEIKKTTESWNFRRNDLTGTISRLESQKLSLRVPTKSMEELIKEREEGYEIQRKANAFMNYQYKVSERSGRIEALNSDIKKCQGELEKLDSRFQLEIRQSEVEAELTDSRNYESLIVNLGTQLKTFQEQLAAVNQEGSNLFVEYQNLKPDVCPTCGQPVESEVLLKYKTNLESRLTELQGKQQAIQENIKACKFNQEDLTAARKRTRELETELSGILRDLTVVSELTKRIETETTELKSLMESAGVTEVPEKVILPENALQIMTSIESDISAWTRISDLDTEITRAKTELATIEDELSKTSGAINDLERYIALTSPVGLIYTSVLSRVATEFSDNQVYYEASQFTSHRVDHLDLECYYITPGGKKVLYESASGGQKTIMDLHLMSKLTEGLGLIVFDEFLKSLDPANHDEMLQIIKDMKVGAIMLVSHQEGISGFQNKTMEICLGPDGMSQIQFV